MRRMMMFVTVALVVAAVIAAGALPTFAKRPRAALEAHLDHGDEVIDEEGCSEEPATREDE